MEISLLTILALFAGSSPAGDANSVIHEFAHHLSQWRDLQTANYEYEMRRICECGIDSSALVKVAVRNGLPWKISYAVSSEDLLGHWTEEARQQVTEFAVGDTVNRELWHAYPSVHELFGIVAEALAEPAASIEVTYNETFGYPAEVTINPHELIVDDKMTYIVQNLELPAAAKRR